MGVCLETDQGTWVSTLVHFTQTHHDFDSRSYCQGQGHSSHIAKICFRAINLNGDDTSYQCCP